MQNLAIAGQRHRARFVHSQADFFTANLARARTESDAAVTIHSADMRSRYPHQRVLNRYASDVFRMLYRFLNAADGLVKFRDDAFAQSVRFADAMTAITQSVLAQLRHQDDGLGAPYIDGGNKIRLVARHNNYGGALVL